MQFIPSNILYSQAIALLTQMQTNFATGKLQSPQDIAQQLSTILTKYDKSSNQPLLDFDYFEDGEPPITPKINSIWGDIQYDVNILQDQIDLLNAATVFANNVIATNLTNATKQNAMLANKLDTLELYAANSTSGNMVVFSDHFGDAHLIDHTFVPVEQQASIKDGILTLNSQGSLVDLTANARVTILANSNGVLGNNQEIEDPGSASINPVTHTPIYKFSSDITPANDVTALTDQNPTTWIEYEMYYIAPSEKANIAANYNFKYQVVPPITSVDTNITTMDWSIGPPNGILELDIQIDLGSIKTFNYITYTPFGLRNNVNNPVIIKSISISSDNNTWTTLKPSDVYVGTNTSSSSVASTSTYTIGNAIWSFDLQSARYIRFNIEQSNPIDVNIGHHYYLNEDNKRVEGPIPFSNNASQYNNPIYVSNGSSIQNVELFKGQRWAIGISEIEITQIDYQTTSSMVTVPLKVGKAVNRIALDADIYVPSNFDSTKSWVNFYVSPDDGKSWFQINDIQDDSLGYPSVITFNDPLPVEFQSPGLSYYNVPGVVDTLRFKIDLNSPNTNETPLVRSYSLKVTTR